jgi:hypothetical protein
MGVRELKGEWRAESRTESRTDDGGLNRFLITRYPNPNLNLITRPRLLMAETRDLKMGP